MTLASTSQYLRTRVYTQAEIESALDGGFLKAIMINGHFWAVRRNGETKTWKTNPGVFRIPVKIGFRNYGAITQSDCDKICRPGDGANGAYWVIESMCMGRLK